MPEPDPGTLAAWARRVWPGGDPGRLRATVLAPEGSARLFVRLEAPGQSLVAMAAPDNPPESRAWHYLADHLAGLGLPVARVVAAEPERGRFLMQDLGRRSLQEAVAAAAGQEEVLALYRPVLELLARLASRGGHGLDTGYCFDGAELTPEFLRRREAGYFLEEYAAGACGLSPEELAPGLEAELELLCRRAGLAEPRGLVHRDFQSRNLVLDARGRPGLVDFQGARLGPAQYDLAALVHDPYVDLPWALRRSLVERYLELRREEPGFDAEAFAAGWPWVAASRLMQALGAYAFLVRRRGKGRFAAYAAPALAALRRLAAEPPLSGLAAWAGLLHSLPEAPLGPEERP
jgi:aminoglycoside/choline kinase family phosphotransferase